jgi:hypothetical protein
MEITRKEKRAAILAFCEGVTKGYSTPRGSGFCTIERNEGNEPNGFYWYVIRADAGDSAPRSWVIAPDDHESKQGDTDFLYCILGLETLDSVKEYQQAIEEMYRQMLAKDDDFHNRLEPLLEAARRVCNESMADYAVTTQAELGCLSEGFEKALGQLQEIVDQYKD